MKAYCNTGLLIMIGVLSLTLVFARQYPTSAQDSGVSRHSKISTLLEERRDALKARVYIIEKLVEISQSTSEALVAAQADLINAEIEMATNDNERIAAIQRKVENAKQLEAIAEQRKHGGRGSEADILMAKAARLGAEIELQRAQEQ